MHRSSPVYKQNRQTNISLTLIWDDNRRWTNRKSIIISCLDSHSDGTHSLQSIKQQASDAMLHFSKSVHMKKQTHLHLGWTEGEYIGKFKLVHEYEYDWGLPLWICRCLHIIHKEPSLVQWYFMIHMSHVDVFMSNVLKHTCLFLSLCVCIFKLPILNQNMIILWNSYLTSSAGRHSQRWNIFSGKHKR